MNWFHRIVSWLYLRSFSRWSAQSKAMKARQAFEAEAVAAQGIEHVEPRIDPATLTAADWMKVLATQEKRIVALRKQSMDQLDKIAQQQHELNVFKRALELVGVNAAAAHAMWRHR